MVKYTVMRRKIFLSLILTIFLLTVVRGNIVIRGKVVTKSKKPIVGARITAYNHVRKKIAAVKSNRKGEFYLNLSESSEYSIIVSKNGFLERSINYPVKKGKKNYTLIVSLIRNENSEVNWDIKSLLRASNNEKDLIFRFGGESRINTRNKNKQQRSNNKPDLLSESIQRKGGMRIFLSTTSDLLGGNNFFSFPISQEGQFTTKFAYLQSAGSNANVIVAGKINSSERKDVTIKNVVQYRFSNKHSSEISFGFSNFGQLDSSTPGNFSNSIENEIIDTFQPIKTLNVSFKDMFQIDAPLQIVYGFDFTHINGENGITFINPKFEFHFMPNKSTDIFLNANQDRKTYDSDIDVSEGESVSLLSPASVSRVNGLDTFINRYTHYDTGFSFLVGNNSKVQLTTFIDKVAGAGLPFVAILKSPFKNSSSTFYPILPSEYSKDSGLKIDFEHRWNDILKTSVIYIYGDTSYINSYDASNKKFSFSKGFYSKISTNVDLNIPSTDTDIKTIYNYSPIKNSIMGIGSFYDYYSTGNNSLNLFIKQKISFLSSDFGRWEAILDLRDILNQGIDVYETAGGDLIIVRNRRSFRGGINFHF